MEEKESLEILLQYIHELPNNQKTALILNKKEGLNQQQIADIMNLNIKAVESLIHRAKQTIKKKYQDE
jgi:RNA polymerase sigma-70 factor (ECF subfamily)